MTDLLYPFRLWLCASKGNPITRSHLHNPEPLVLQCQYLWMDHKCKLFLKKDTTIWSTHSCFFLACHRFHWYRGDWKENNSHHHPQCNSNIDKSVQGKNYLKYLHTLLNLSFFSFFSWSLDLSFIALLCLLSIPRTSIRSNGDYLATSPTPSRFLHPDHH